MTEIEIKAHVADTKLTENLVSKIARFTKETEKKDTYWQKDVPGEEKSVKVRFREEANETYLTYKRKELRGQIEVNDELEFTLSDRVPLETLLGDLGFSPYTTKCKQTRSFSYTAPDGNAVTIELSRIDGLGDFIELEILAHSPGKEEISQAQKTLRETLALCGIGEEAIESRFYTELLADRKKNN